jgi:hypothetical protein
MGVVSCGTTMLDQGVFENIGAVTWDTTVKTSGFTAVSGNGYFCNTTSAAFTVTLPASPSAGDIVGIKDYANTADTNNITIGRNGSNIQGDASDFVINTEGRSVLLVYVDATKGWLVTSSAQANDIARRQFITATGGTITTSGDFKIHTFTGPGTFCVSCAGNPLGSTSVDYMVVAGGAAGGTNNDRTSGGGGAGGYRESSGAASGCYSRSPLGACVSALPLSVQGYPITVGAGGIAPPSAGVGGSGSNSIFSSITSAGGGGGGISGPTNISGASGGSGGGASHAIPTGVGSGNTPPTTPPQGNNGGNGYNSACASGVFGGGGGGGAIAVGGNASTSCSGRAGAGGGGATSSINGSSTARGGGGGGNAQISGSQSYLYGLGGLGGGGQGGHNGGPQSGCFPASGCAGTANTGGGGGGGSGAGVPGPVFAIGSNGGSGIVIIRYKYQ